jgi:periplasmic protein TonB
MTIIQRAVLPLTALLVLPLTSLDAMQQAPDDDIVVLAPNSAEVIAWSARVGENISQQMRYPRDLGPTSDPEGLVEVTFECSEDGRPSNVALLESSGSRRLDRAGMAAVQRVASLHPLPSGIDHRQVYRAQLLFDTDDGNGRTRRQLEAMRARADRGNAALLQRRSNVAMVPTVTLLASR